MDRGLLWRLKSESEKLKKGQYIFSEDFFDVCLTCESNQINAHKVIISAKWVLDALWSPYKSWWLS